MTTLEINTALEISIKREEEEILTWIYFIWILTFIGTFYVRCLQHVKAEHGRGNILLKPKLPLVYWIALGSDYK